MRGPMVLHLHQCPTSPKFLSLFPYVIAIKPTLDRDIRKNVIKTWNIVTFKISKNYNTFYLSRQENIDFLWI